MQANANAGLSQGELGGTAMILMPYLIVPLVNSHCTHATSLRSPHNALHPPGTGNDHNAELEKQQFQGQSVLITVQCTYLSIEAAVGKP